MALFGNKTPRFGFDPETQGAVDSYAAAPVQQASTRPNWAQGISDIGTGLMAAQAAIDGDFAASAGLSQSIGATQRAQQAAAQKRQEEWQDWVTRERWKRDNPSAPNPNDTERDYAFISKQLGADAANDWLRRKGDPDVAMSLPGNRFYAGPRSGIGNALGGGASPGNLDDTPVTEDGYTYTPGPGGRANQSNWKSAGGGSGNAAGNFQPGTSLFFNRR